MNLGYRMKRKKMEFTNLSKTLAASPARSSPYRSLGLSTVVSACLVVNRWSHVTPPQTAITAATPPQTTATITTRSLSYNPAAN